MSQLYSYYFINLKNRQPKKKYIENDVWNGWVSEKTKWGSVQPKTSQYQTLPIF